MEERLQKYRVLPFWSWNDKLNREELRRQIDCFAAAGCGGFFIHSRVGLVTPYLSREWMELVKEACVYAREKGMTAWLYDEDMWPSGYAGGKVPAKGERYRDRYICMAERSAVRAGDVIKTEFAREGKEYAIVLRVSSAGNLRFNGQSYIDTLNPDAVREFLDCTLEEYERLFDGKLRDYVGGIFTDEPSYVMRTFTPDAAVPYSECMDELFFRASGRDLGENMVKLFTEEGNYREIRFLYYKCLAERFTESFVKQYARRCEEHGIRFTGHLMGEESCVTQTAWIGSAMANYPYFTYPGVDKIFRGIDDLVQYKQLTSVCEQFGKEQALCECFAGIGQECGMAERKRIVDFQAVNGITLVNPHLSLYSMRGERKRDYPPNLFYQQPYFEQEHIFHEYVAGVSAAAGYGRRSVHILIIHPLSTVWSRFAPCTLDKMRPAACDKKLKRISYGLQANGIEFHYADEQILAEHARAEGRTLVVGNYTYDLVLLCGNEVLFSSTIELLKNVRVYALNDRVLENGAKKVRLEGVEVFSSVAAMLEKIRRGEPSVFSSEKAGVVCSAREGEEGKLYLFVNTARTERNIRLGEAIVSAMADATEIDPLMGDKLRTDVAEFAKFYPLQSKILKIGSTQGSFSRSKPGKCKMRQRLQARVCDQNALCLERADFSVNGTVCFQNTHLSKIWHSTFYPLPDGTPYAVEYKFEYEGGEVAFAAIENAENLDAIYCNGVRAEPLRRRGAPQILDKTAYCDPCFTRVLLPAIRKGENCLRLEGRKVNNITGIGMHRGLESSEYYPTEAEYAYIVGDFAVEKGKIVKATKRLRGNITDKGYPYYAGSIEAEAEYVSKESETLIVEQRNGASAIVALYVDGKWQGSRFSAPYRWEISVGKGKHTLCLKGYGTLFNMFGPHYLRNYKRKLWITAWDSVDPGQFDENELYEALSLGDICVFLAEQSGNEQE